RLSQFERQCSLGGKHDVFVACERCACGSCSATCHCANSSPLTTSGETADERSQSRASPRPPPTALAFGFQAARNCRRTDIHITAVDIHRIKPDLEKSSAFEASERMSGDHRAMGS